MNPKPQGIIVIDKPAGPSSFGVVKAVRRLLKVKKIGHLGTLDPFAVGVLPLCLNEATKLVPFLIDAPKTYRATIVLGTETNTQDSTGEVIAHCPQLPAPEEVYRVAAAFIGEQWQTPPLFSALHYQGQRLYQLARQGTLIDIPARRISILDLAVESVNLPELIMTVTCSKGTYIRTLAADIGSRLGCGAHLQALQRQRVGPFTLDQAISLSSNPDEADVPGLLDHLIPLVDCLPHLPTLEVDSGMTAKLRQGQSMLLDGKLMEMAWARPEERLKVVCKRSLIAVAEVRDSVSARKVQPVRVFNPC
ncbi:tRNA pseudouridine(55) synthase TruB [Desulfobacca acetoxidans]